MFVCACHSVRQSLGRASTLGMDEDDEIVELKRKLMELGGFGEKRTVHRWVVL